MRCPPKFCYIPLIVLVGLFCLINPHVAFSESRRTIVAFGNSLTAGLGVPAEQSYPARLENKLKAENFDYQVINAGVSGETTAGGLRRVSWILKNKPDIVILELGANDGLRGLSLQEMEKNLAKIIQQLLDREVSVILAGMKIPPNYGAQYTNAFEAVYPRLAKRFKIDLIPFFLEGVAAKPALNQADGIHPTAQGYAVITEEIWPMVKNVIVKRFPGKKALF